MFVLRSTYDKLDALARQQREEARDYINRQKRKIASLEARIAEMERWEPVRGEDGRYKPREKVS